MKFSMPFEVGQRVVLSDPSRWCGHGGDVDAVYTVTGTKISTDFGSGAGVQVSPAIQPALGESIWYDAPHFVPLEKQEPKPMTVTIDDGEGSSVVGDNLLDALENACIFSVTRLDDGRFHFLESCDACYSANLTKEQVLALADELRALAWGAA